MIARSLFVIAGTLSLLFSGCHKASVASYRIPKEKDPDFPMAAAPAADADSSNAGGSSSGGAMANAAVPVAEGAELAWTAPTGWKPKPPSPMRKGSYEAPGEVDCSITAFPGDVGGELANVNRWRAQVQLPPIAEASLPNQVSRAEHDGLQFDVIDFAGTEADAQRIIGAMVPYRGATWFFKLVGSVSAVEKAKPEFVQLLESVKPANQRGAAVTAASDAAPSAMAAASVPTAQGVSLAWTAPAGWEEKPRTAMRRGSFRVPGSGGQDGDVSVTAFPGDVGGELANVNRWRGQVQLPPISPTELPNAVSRSEHDGLQFSIVDVTGTGDQPPRILGAIVPYAGSTWFFKLMGPNSVVENSKPAFLQFLRSVKPSSAASTAQ